MTKTDRLFQITQYLRSHRIVTAAQLADWLEVSQRTIYRDIQRLMMSDVPINGEAGTGYWLEPGFDFPAIQYTEEELEALFVGMRLTMECADHRLRQAAQTLLHKVEMSLPQGMRGQLRRSAIEIPLPLRSTDVAEKLTTLRQAIHAKNSLLISYLDEKGLSSERRLNPLALNFWGKTWTLIAWCHLRDDFRSFRADRLVALKLTETRFVARPGQSLADYHQRLSAQGCK